MKKVIDDILLEATILGMISEADEREVKYKDNDGQIKTMKVPVALRMRDPQHPARIAAEKLKQDDGTDKKGTEEPETPSSATSDQDNTQTFGKTFGDDPTGSDSSGDTESFVSDEEIENIAKELGFEKGKLPESLMKSDPTILTALKKGFHKSDDWTPAPGSKTSLFNETMSMVGTQLAVELANRGIETNPEQLGKVLEELYGNTTAWKDATGGKVNQVEIVTQSALQKTELIRESARVAGIELEKSEVKNYYGTRTSLENQYNEIMDVDDNVELIGGNGKEIKGIPTDILSVHQLLQYNDIDGNPVSKEEVKQMINNPNDRDTIKKFLALSALNGGGGGNPSDTATIIKGDGKLAFLAYSDKTSLGDQQANSTPAKYVETLSETVGFLEDLGYEFDEEDKAAVKSTLEKMGKSFAETERQIGEALAAPLRAISDTFADKKTRPMVQELFDKEVVGLGAGKPPSNTSKKIAKKIAEINPEKPAFVKANKAAQSDPNNYSAEDVSWGYYLNQAGWEEGSNPTDEQKLQAYLLSMSDPREFTLAGDDGPVETTLGAGASTAKEIEYASKMVAGLANAHKDEKNKFKLSDDNADAILNVTSNVEKLRKQSLDVMTAGFAELNEHEIEDENGNRFGLGNMMGGYDLIEKLHLYMVDDKPSGLYAMDSVFIIAGKDGVSPNNMKECLGVDSTEELLKQIKTEPPEKEGPTINYLGGEELHESEISRSGNPDELARTKDGKLIYLVDGKYETASEDESTSKEWGKPLGRITGRKVLAYIQDEKGERTPIGFQNYRTKGGYKLQTTYTFSPELQKCLDSNPITNINELTSSIHLNTLMLMEMAARV